MLTLKEIINGLLKEDVSTDQVLDAINNKSYVRIKYDDTDGKGGKGTRLIQPMAVGTTKKGFPVVRAFQVGGSSKRGAPKWKFFRLDRIVSWMPMKRKKFYMPPDRSYGEYNRTGDKTMGTFIDNAKFGDEAVGLDAEKIKTQMIKDAPKVSVKNTSGPIKANQQWKRNVFTSQPNSEKYKMVAKNIKDTENDFDRFAAWDAAEKEAEKQNMLNQAEKPTVLPSEPIGGDKEYDEDDIDFNQEDFINNNRKR